MNDDELASLVNELPGRFTDRLPEAGLADVADAARAGEWGEAVDILLAGLARSGTPVSASERDELRELLEFMGMPTDPIGTLNVEG